MGQQLTAIKEGFANMSFNDLDIRKCICEDDSLPDNYMSSNNTFMKGAYEENSLYGGSDYLGEHHVDDHVLVMKDDVANEVVNPFEDDTTNHFDGLPSQPQQDNF